MKREKANLGWLMGGALFLLTLCGAMLVGCRSEVGPEVVVYASQDQVFAGPLLQEFSRQSGVRVRALFDSEAVKTVGLANRLKAEVGVARCDVFWNNEIFRTRLLQRDGILAAGEDAIVFGERRRVLAVNARGLTEWQIPRSLVELTNPVWRGRVALAYPVFGTTSTHFLALRQRWGVARWETWCRALAANAPKLVDGNSVAARLAAQGEVAVALTDSDDVEALRRDGKELREVELVEDGLVIPNTAALVKGAPHADQGRALLRFLASESTLTALKRAGASLEGGGGGAVRIPSVEWESLMEDHAEAIEQLKGVFLR